MEIPQDRPPTNDRSIILVLGMDRCGTSLCASVLHALGMSLGANLLPADRFNERGYFEDREICRVHQRVLAVLGRSWDTLTTVRPFPPGWWQSAPMEGYCRELAAIARSRLAAAPCAKWGFKDPRTVLLLPLWTKVFDELAIRPVFVICVRHPGAVAQSLSARDGFPPRFSEMLWLEKTLRACQAASSQPNCLIHYEDWFVEPSKCVDALLGVTGLTPSERPETLAEVVDSILSHELRHDGEIWPIGSLAAETLYNHLRACSHAPNGEVLGALDSALAVAADFICGVEKLVGLELASGLYPPPYGACTEQDLRLIQSELPLALERLQQHDPMLLRLRWMLADRDRQLVRSRDEVARAQQLVEERELLLQQPIEGLAQPEALALMGGERRRVDTEQVTGPGSKVAELHSRIAELERQVENDAERTQTLEADLRDRERSIAISQQTLNDLRQNLCDIRSSLCWKLTAPIRTAVALPAMLHRLALELLYFTVAFRFAGKPLAKLLSVVNVPGARFLLPQTPLFDSEFYRLQYADTDGRSKNLWAHYIGFGSGEGRDPHPLFNTDYYKAQYSDIAKSGLNPLLHYSKFGAAEKRNPSSYFDSAYYLERYADVRRHTVNPLLHYWLYGRHEGREVTHVQSLPADADFK